MAQVNFFVGALWARISEIYFNFLQMNFSNTFKSFQIADLRFGSGTGRIYLESVDITIVNGSIF